MIEITKSNLPRLAVSFIIAVFFMFASQQTYAQNLGTVKKEDAKKEVKTEKVKLEKEKGVATENSEKTLQSTKKNQVEQSETRIESKETLEKEKKELESAEKSETEKRLIAIKKNREEIELQKKHGKLNEKEYEDAINKLDKMEKEVKSKDKPKLDSKGGK